MRPKQSPKADHDDLFRSRLDQIINMRHPLVLLAERIDWAWIEEHLTDRFADNGRPAEPVRFMIGMFVLKHTYTLSDEQLWERWEHDPYFQYFTGEEFFQHELPHERSGLSHWRKRLGDRLDILLQESLRVAHDTGALKKSDLARVTVDTTVPPKNVTFPTDAKLLNTSILKLAKLAKRHGVELRQSYLRVARRAAMMVGRYAHAKQFKRMNRELKFLRTRLGRVIRDIERKIEGDQALKEVFVVALIKARQIHGQKPRQRGWKLRRTAYAAPLTPRSVLRLACPRGRVHRQGSASSPAIGPRDRGAEPAKPTSSASSSRSPPPTSVARADHSGGLRGATGATVPLRASSTPRRSPAIPTTATP